MRLFTSLRRASSLPTRTPRLVRGHRPDVLARGLALAGRLTLAALFVALCALPQAAQGQIALGNAHTCALRANGTVVCWGNGSNGRLGYGNTTAIGDNESDFSALTVGTGPGAVTQLAAGSGHTCALRANGTVVCWGSGISGRLGYGNTTSIGDDESDFSALTVGTGAGAVTQIAAGGSHTCALRTNGTVVCWGLGSLGRLGYGNTNNIGDNESDLSGFAVGTGPSAVTQISAGNSHTCALRANGTVVCWGLGSAGQLGYGNTNQIGDNESDFSALTVGTGPSAVTQIAAGSFHTCALRANGTVVCWGSGSAGQLGYGNTNQIGDNESDFSALTVGTGPGAVTQIAAGSGHTCALRANGTVVCWGLGSSGALGYGNTNAIGDDESDLSGFAVGTGPSAVTQLAAGSSHTCALRANGTVVCWGSGTSGQLGYGNLTTIGDNESDLSGFAVTIGGAALPVELASFTASADGRTARLAWTTASETNNAGFTVERQTTTGAWSDASALIAGHGTTTERHAYTFDVAGLTAGTHTFRLRQTRHRRRACTTAPSSPSRSAPRARRSSRSSPTAPARLACASSPSGEAVRAEVYDVLGRRVSVLFDGSAAVTGTAEASAGPAHAGHLPRTRHGERAHHLLIRRSYAETENEGSQGAHPVRAFSP